jgi:Protein of unknown function (DUF3105)
MASRKEEKERLRREREERERAAESGARRRRLIGYAVGGALALAAVVAIAVVALSSGGEDHRASTTGRPAPNADFPTEPIPPQRVTDFAKATRASGCVARSFPNEGRGHTTSSVKYRTNPPTSGRHNPVAADDGPYAQSPGDEHLVHSLEHGRIVFQFRPSAPEKLKGQLKSLFDEDPYHVILVPNAAMPYEVAATAWTEMLGCKRASDGMFDALRAFRQRNRDRGPEFVP